VISRALAFLALLYLLGYALFAVALPRPAGDQPTDAIVVLTGAPGRIERGLDLLAAGKAKRLLVSGVARTVRPIDLAAQYPDRAALFRCCVDLGRESVDTRSNADEVASWVKRRGFKTVRLVTTDWHMRRARFELSRQLPDGVTLAGDAVESSPSFRQLFMEYNKYLLRRAAVFVGL
jgi:uncharacterized SAM-binding protein YcdF (DUF218 family)